MCELVQGHSTQRNGFSFRELCHGTGEKPVESLLINIREQTNTGDFVAAICYRLPDQEEQVDESLL